MKFLIMFIFIFLNCSIVNAQNIDSRNYSICKVITSDFTVIQSSYRNISDQIEEYMNKKDWVIILNTFQMSYNSKGYSNYAMIVCKQKESNNE